jgi:hypothetical protein
MESRNLRLMWLDDQSSEHEHVAFPDIDVVRAAGEERMEGDEWLVHCEALATDKIEDFDLLSIDINFAQDRTDPGRVLDLRARGEGVVGLGNGRGDGLGDETNCAGLYHGMMALARHVRTDANGNRLPIAWEIRTKAPASYEATSRILVEAVRAYGLLRAYLAEPADGESLFDCVVREHEDAWGAQVPDAVRKAALLGELMRYDLTKQGPLSGGVDKVVRRLLPRWRRQLVLGVLAGRIRIEQQALLKTVRALEGAGPDAADEIRGASIVLGGWSSKHAYGIRLASILTDLSTGGPVDVRSARPEVGRSVLQDGKALSVIAWLKELHQASGAASQGYLDTFAYLGHEVGEWLRAHRGTAAEAAAPFWRSPRYGTRRYFTQCLIHLIARTYGMAGPQWEHLLDEDLLAAALGIPRSDQTFTRCFREATEFSGLSKDDVLREHEKGLKGADSVLFAMHPWMGSFFGDVLVKEVFAGQHSAAAIVRQKFPGVTPRGT